MGRWEISGAKSQLGGSRAERIDETTFPPENEVQIPGLLLTNSVTFGK